MSKKVAHVSVKLEGPKDNVHGMIKRFMKKVKKYKVIKEYREKTDFYEKKSDINRRQRRRRKSLAKLSNNKK